jgi:hypothetical protein
MDAVNLLKYMSANLLMANPDKTQFLIAGGEKGRPNQSRECSY